MRRRFLLFAALPLLLGISAIGAESGARSVEPPESSEVLWRFDTHG